MAPITLAIETSSTEMGLCVTRNGEVVSLLTDEVDERRSEKLWIEIDRLLWDAGLTVQDIDLFAVCVGPGGFTGLRVGLAAAKGFATAANRPMVGVTSLEAAAATAASARLVVALVNAYKGQVYSQLFSIDREGGLIPTNEPRVSTFRVALEAVRNAGKLVFVGNAAVANEEEIMRLGAEMRQEDRQERSRSWTIQGPEVSLAETIARLALVKYINGESGSAENVTACYVRPADAEIKLAKGLLSSKIGRVRRQE